MKRFCIFLLVAGLSISAFAQYDDIYDGSTYKSKKETKEVTTSTSTNTRSIDEYNRVGTTQTSSNVASDLDLEEDYHYTKEIVKYYDPTAVTIENPEYVYIYNNTDPEEQANSSANIYVNLGWTNWYSPWYYDSWFAWNPWGSIWYDPWYDPFWVHPYSHYPGYYPYAPYRPYPYAPYHPYHPPHPAPAPHHGPDHHHGPSHHGPVDAHSRDYHREGNTRGNATRPSSNTRNTNGNVSRPTNRNTNSNVNRPSNTNRTNTTASPRGGRGSSSSTNVQKRNVSSDNSSFTPSRGGGNSRSTGTINRGGGNSRAGGAAPRGGRR